MLKREAYPYNACNVLACLQDLSYKERHWHEECFMCSVCQHSLANRPFAPAPADATADKVNKIYCSECFDESFSPHCDRCTSVFKAGLHPLLLFYFLGE